MTLCFLDVPTSKGFNRSFNAETEHTEAVHFGDY